jgi:hypothetical protein
MSTIHLHQTTNAMPQQFVAGLPDFGPGRSKLFGNSADDFLKVHSTTNSNMWGGASGDTYTFTPRPNGPEGGDVDPMPEDAQQ